VKTLPSSCGTTATRYIEAQIADIALANELAHEVLGRTLDELPPQTRKLLALLVSLVERECTAQSARRADYRFSRRQVREATKWGDTQLKIHLARRGVDLSKFNFGQIIDSTRDWTGAEIEQCVISALTKARLNEHDLTEDTLIDTAVSMVPLARAMKEQINHIRQWAFQRAVRASPVPMGR